MNSSETNSQRVFDPDIREWSSPRLQKLESELGPALPTICWSGFLHPIVKNWVKKQLIQDIVNDKSFADYADLHQIHEEAQQQQVHDASKNITPSCQPDDIGLWYLEKHALMFWANSHWNHRLESLYLSNKHKLDKVTCGLIRVSSQQLAFELSLRLKNNEVSFSQISAKFAEGPERKFGGRYKNQPMRAFPKEVQSIIRKMKPGEVSKPHSIGERYAILSMESFTAAEFDELTKEIVMMDELEIWLTEVVHHLKSHLKSNY